MGEVETKAGSSRRVDRIAITLSISSLLFFTLASIVPEINTDRYGQIALTNLLPFAKNILSASGPLYTIALLLSGVIVLHWLVSRHKYREFDENGFCGSPGSQARIWFPYIAAWFLSAGFGAVQGATIYALVSVFMTGSASQMLDRRAVGRHLDGILKWPIRAVVVSSLVFGLIAHGRAFAPYAVWPGGWFVGADRLQGVLPHPNTLGWIAALGVIVEILYRRSKIGMLFAGLAALALVLSGSRTASISLMLGVLGVILLAVSRRSHSAKIFSRFLAPIAVVLVLVFAIADGVSADSFNGRQVTWDAAIKAFAANWLTGSGPGAYLAPDQLVASVPYAHNQILQTAAELGLFGLICLTLHSISLIRFVKNGGNSTLGVALVIMWFVMFAFENPLRFASTGFFPQVFFFQLAIHLASNGGRNSVISKLGGS